MFSKNGFTLVEMMAVLMVLAIITVVTVPLAMNLVQSANESQKENFLNDLYLSAEAYIQDNIDTFSILDIQNSKAYISIEDIIQSDYINSQTYDPNTGEILENESEYTIIVTKDENNTLNYEFVYEKLLMIPTYSITPTQRSIEKKVTINYPKKQVGFEFSYSIDNGITWIVEENETVNLSFSTVGTIIARVFTGTKYLTASSYTITELDLIIIET
ncbi:MAG: type II secretion system protein [Bacilli bacterium]